MAEQADCAARDPLHGDAEALPCKEWGGTIHGNGYGVFSVAGQQFLAHRIEWERANGRPVPPGLVVRHRCDNRPCVEPTHLLLGTQADNQHDKRDRGRAAKGTRNRGGTRLSEHDVRQIRALLRTGMTRAAIAKTFGVSPMMVGHIEKGRKWAWVT